MTTVPVVSCQSTETLLVSYLGYGPFTTWTRPLASVIIGTRSTSRFFRPQVKKAQET